MRVEELIEALSHPPHTATVIVVIAKDERYDGALVELDEAREAQPLSAEHEHGEVLLRLSET